MARKLQALTGRTILVVDDQQETLASVRQLLEREVHRVITAECGERALCLLKECEVDLLLVDYFMPHMSGEELVRRVRSFDRYLQIVVQTGYSGEKPPRKVLAELDIQGYHDKSDGPEQLLLWIDVGLKAHQVIQMLRERERTQAELVANVSHEFRTPLGIVHSYVQLLCDGEFGKLPAAALAPLAAINEAVRCLSELVVDFLSYAKLQARALQVQSEWVATADVLKYLETLAGKLIEKKSVDLTFERDHALVGFHTDSAKLNTILRNLLSNAAKFTQAGSIRVRIGRDGDNVRFAVRDTGPGIPRAQLANIFEPFRQLDGSVTRHHSGIGLGLTLCRELAVLLGGSVQVESEPGFGSTFTLVLPAAGVAAQEASVSSPDRPDEVEFELGIAAA